MPRLKSWGLGGYRRSSLAKRIRDILNLGTEAPDSMGIGRFAVHSAGLPALLGYAPEVPNVSPLFTYHEQYDFNKADDVDLIDTWDETMTGTGIVGLHLRQYASTFFSRFDVGASAGDFTQYQENVRAYYAETGLEQDIYFCADVGYDMLDDPGQGDIYIGFTPTSANAIEDREYGIGFLYDGEEQLWYFTIDNHTAAGRTSVFWPLRLEEDIERMVPYNEGYMSFRFHLTNPRVWEEGNKPWVRLQWGTMGDFTFSDTVVLREEDVIREQKLRLTFGAINREGGPGLRVYPVGVKEIIPKIQGLGGEI